MAELVDIVTKNSTSRSVPLRIIDSGDGSPENAVSWNTAGIDLWYRRERSAKVSITEASLAALTTAYTSGGFILVGDGKYSLDIPDAALATGANYVDYGGTVTGMVVIGGRIRLVDFNLESAAITLPTIPANWITASGIAADAIGASELAADAVTEIVTGVFARTFSSAYNLKTFDEMIKILVAVEAGPVTGAGTSSIAFKNLANTGTAVAGTTDAVGNRSSISYTP